MHLRQTLDHAFRIARRHLATVHIENGTRREQTWSQLRGKAERGAQLLRAKGVQAGDRVVVAGANSDRWIEAWYAGVCADAVVVPMNIRLSVREMVEIMNDCEAKILIHDRSCQAVAQDMQGGHFAIDLDSDWESLVSSPLAATDGADLVGTMTDAGAVATIYYTGGTTGKPKGVMLTHDNLMYTGLVSRGVTHIDHCTRHLHVAPLFHIADGSIVPWVTWVGGTHYTIGKFEPSIAAEVLASEKITHVMMVPAMVAALVATLDDRASVDVGSGDAGGRGAELFPDVKRVIYGGASMPAKTLARALEIFSRAGFMQVYGMSELSPYATVLEPEFHRHAATPERLASAGRAIPGIDVRISDLRSGELCPVGIPGEVQVRGPGVMKGYWNNAAATSQAIVDGWMRTGDIGVLDSEGFLTILDRAKDMIITGGENVYSTEVEAALLRHPEVRDCAVFGVPDEKWGETVCAVVSIGAESRLTQNQLLAHCRGHLGGFKCPRQIVIQTEPLPRSGAGKILKHELREPYWRQHARRVN